MNVAPKLTAAEYHADYSRVSNSMLSVFRQSRQQYCNRFVTRTEPAPESTPAMRLGSLVHLAMLEPSIYQQIPVVDQRCEATYASGANKGSRCTNEASGTNNGRWLCGVHSKGLELDKPPTHYVLDKDSDVLVPVCGMSTKEKAEVEAMANALLDNEKARALLELTGERERTHYWQDPKSGLWCKCRYDFICPDIFWDLKTSHDASPRGFAEKSAALGYHRQNAHYRYGNTCATGEVMPSVFIVVQNKRPYAVATYELDDDALQLGESQNESALLQLATCHKHNDWREPWQKKITTLSLPKWSQYASEYEVIE